MRQKTLVCQGLGKFCPFIRGAKAVYNKGMKIEGPDRSRNIADSKKSDKAGAADGDFGAYMTAGAKKPQAGGATHSIARVDALLAVQSIESPTERAARRRMRERGEDILKELDKLRHGLLTGSMTLGDVINMADVVASHREKVNDPKLIAILDEIDLRAQIELAKAKKAMESRVN